MPRQLLSIVLDLNEIAKENQTGYWCNNQDNIINPYGRFELDMETRLPIEEVLYT